MNRFLILCLFLFSLFGAKGQNCPLEQNIPIRTNARDTIELEVFDIVNNDLSDPDQGVCSVYLDFIHNVVGDFEVWLESPAGQPVQLIGPNASTPVNGLGFEYLITFLSEGLGIPPANQQWDNDLPNPATGGVTEGEFFPYSGRLDELDIGPVNGTWLLIMETQTTTITLDGILREVKINFCDPFGENCCFAEAGQFAVDSVLQVCSGIPPYDSLPVIDFGESRPDTLEYGYTWLLTSDSLIIDQDSLAAWGTLPAGTYTMYGLSYARSDSMLLPTVDSMLRIDTLRNQLARPAPPFCGDLTENAWTITVLPGSDTTRIEELICAGDSVRLADTTLTTSGKYTFTLQNQSGCDSTVIIDLTVTPTFNQVIDTTICDGNGINIGPNLYTESGTFVDTLQSQAGCDSIITLNLAVGETSRDTIRQLVCNGQTISVGGQNFDTTDVYEVRLTNRVGCDSIIVLDLTVLDPVAVVAEGERTLTCSRTSLLLDGGASLPATGELSYRWERQRDGMLAVDIVGTDSLLTVDRPGRYFLQVQLRQDSVVCSERTTEILISADTLPPPVEAGNEQRIDCNQPTAILGSPLLMVDTITTITWRLSTGAFPGDAAAARPVVDRAGIYTVTVTNTQNGCSAADSVRVTADTVAPQFSLQNNGPLSCSRPIVEVGPTPGSDQGSPFTYAWSGSCIVSATDTPFIQVNCADTFQLAVTNTVNGCRTVDSIVVVEDDASPTAAVVADTVPLDCSAGEAVLDASPSENGTIAWWQNGIQLTTTPQLAVTDTGTYQVIVTNTSLNCADTLAVAVTADCVPMAAIAPPASLTCERSRVVLDATASADGNPLSFRWIGPDDACLSPNTGPQVEVRCGGIYQVIVTNTVIGQADTAQVEVLERTAIPVAMAGADQTLTCANPEATLRADGSSSGPDIEYTWIDDLGDTVGITPTITVLEAGSYVLEVLNGATGCRAEDVVQVNRDADVPDLRFGSTLLPCDRDTFRFSALVVPPGEDYTYQWTGPGITGNSDSAFVLIEEPGTYRLEVRDTLTGCQVVESVLVEEQACGPCLEPLLADTLTCNQPEISLTIVSCSDCTGCTYSWSTVNGRIVTDPTQATVQVAEPGTYRVVVTDAQGISNEQSIEVTENKPVVEVPQQTDVALTCAEPVVLLGQNLPNPGDSLFYFWRNEADEVLNVSNSPLLDVDSVGWYLLEAQDAATGCSVLDSLQVTLDQEFPLIEAGDDDTLDCANPVVRLEGQILSDELHIRYEWTSTGGAVRGGGSSLNPLVEGPGLYLLTAQDTLNGCTTTDSVRLIPPSDFPMLGQLAVPVLGCSQNEVEVVAPITPDLDLRYSWTDASGTLLGDSSSIVLNAPDNYQLQVRNTRNNCTDQLEFTVAVDTVPPPTTLPPQVELGCADLSVELGAGLPPTGPYTFSWSSAAGMDLSGATGPDIRISRADTFFLAVQDTLTNCQAIDTSIVTVTTDRPQIQVPAAYSLTCTDPEQLLEATVLGNPANYTYSWSTTDGQLSVDNEGLNLAVATAGTYRLLATDRSTGCQAEVFTTVRVDRQAPQVVIDTLGTLPLDCRQASVRINAGSTLTASGLAPQFSWLVLSGTTPAGDLTGSELTLSEAVSLQLIAIDPGNGCRDSTIFSITVDRTPPPVPVLTVPDTLDCQQASVSVSATNWDPNLSTSWLLNGDTLALATGSVEVSEPGPLQLITTNETNGCRAEAQTVIVQTSARPELAIVANGTLGCAGGTVGLRVEDARSGVLSNISWNGPDGGILGTTTEREVLVGLSGTYSVSAAYVDSGCADTTSFTLVASAGGIDSVIVVIDKTGCGADATGTIRIEQVFGGQAPYLYAFTAAGPLTMDTQARNLPPGDYQVRVEDANGCTWTQSVRIPAGSDLAIELGPDREIVSGDSIELIPTLTGRFTALTWRAQDQVVGRTDRLRVAPTFTVSYRLTGVGDNGCTVEDIVTVFVQEELAVYLPTVFAPDSEQEGNRIFFVQAGEQVAAVERFEVFNRWGELLFGREDFAANDPAFGWDGRFRGEKVNAGVYVYQVVVRLRNGERRLLYGDITLLR